MHREAFVYVERQLADLSLDLPNTDVIELGSCIVNGSVRPLFPATRSYVGVDLRAGHGVDVVADAATYQPAEPVGLVVTTEMLEHAADQEAVVANIGRMLVPGGVLILTAAGVERAPHNNDGHHGVPEGEPYANVAEEALVAYLTAAGFVSYDICRNIRKGDIYCTATMGERSVEEIEATTPAPVRRKKAKDATPDSTLR